MVGDCKHCGKENCVPKDLICRKCGKRQISVWQTNPLMGIIVIIGFLGAMESVWKWLKDLF